MKADCFLATSFLLKYLSFVFIAKNKKNVFFLYNNIFFQRNGDFNWSAEQQSIILGSFFYGYVLTQVLLKSKNLRVTLKFQIDISLSDVPLSLLLIRKCEREGARRFIFIIV